MFVLRNKSMLTRHRTETHVKMMVISAFRRWNRLILAEAEVATAAATTTTVTSGGNATYQEQCLQVENGITFDS